MSAPDVSVVLAVYNTMPYLTRCLTSLAEQSIGRERMEIIAVDDGSTDGGGRELDRFARAYRGAVTVIHQPNSGGPAVPSNRALERANGRYVFFVGADDFLGPEALQRLVSAADRCGSDVVLGRTVGVNSRYLHQEVFAESADEIGLFDSALPWSLSNTKLFRRDLIERHGLRYPENMSVFSDQPFTLAACLRARRISVLNDYDFYYAVRRLNAHNITYRAHHTERLRCAAAVIDTVAGLVGPGKERDTVLLRHFSWELGNLVQDDFRRLERGVQEQVHAGIRSLAERYLTDGIRERLEVETRLRLSIAQYRPLDDLLEAIRQDAERGVPVTVADGDRWYAAYPGFREARLALPDSWFDVTDAAADWLARLEATGGVWERGAGGARGLVVTARSPRPDLTELCSGGVGVSAGEVHGSVLGAEADDTGTTLRVRFDVEQLLADVPPGGGLRTVRAQVNAFGMSGSAPLRAPRRSSLPRLLCRRGLRLYLITPTTSHRGQLVIAVAPVTPRKVVAYLRRRRRGGNPS